MSSVVARLPHECGTNKGLVVFEDGHGFCFRCKTHIPNVLSDEEIKNLPVLGKKSDEEIKREMDEISSYKTISLPSRSLKEEYLLAANLTSLPDGETMVKSLSFLFSMLIVLFKQ